ncbi:MAG: DUF3793 family protein [Firmicutes bacterium]|nr:DUF3793 family protein [Bacillota bacterium]
MNVNKSKKETTKYSCCRCPCRRLTERLVICHGSPTLAGIKTANLFRCPRGNDKRLRFEISELDRRLSPKGVHAVLLRARDGSALVYIYRENRLFRDLEDETVLCILSSLGYDVSSSHGCVAELFRRINECRCSHEFPHEVGFFLGYPPCDVVGFIENNAECAKCVGCWKVYGDESEAKKTFERYKKCSALYYTLWERGKSIERLTVAD